ncbi:hypothetical protein [Streptomyces sp. NPDC058671]|uniref:hypothetical protein n=1 Tax=Streptomyces sp. NPDC058671 TaxID=3346590 RepID=UPI0036465275
MTTLAPDDMALTAHVHGTARHEGLAPALAALGSAVLPGLLPCGPAGHAVVDARTHAEAEESWLDGLRHPRERLRETAPDETVLPGGSVVTTRVARPRRADGSRPDATGRARSDAYALGLVWLRLGLSEGLRSACVAHLAHRRTGDSTLLQQQLVKGTIADVLVEHLEVRAVLTGAAPGDLDAGMLHHLHGRITAADREQVRLLGASGYLRDSPGMTAYASEVLAEAHTGTEADPVAEAHAGTDAPTGAEAGPGTDARTGASAHTDREGTS